MAAVAGEPCNTRYRAGASPYPDRTLTGWIRSAYPDAPPKFWTVSSADADLARSDGAGRVTADKLSAEIRL